MLEKQLNNHFLTTAEIYYFFPDHPHILQSFVWQDYDQTPKFPVLNKFLSFWDKKIEGKIHSVYVASKQLIHTQGLWYLNKDITLS